VAEGISCLAAYDPLLAMSLCGATQDQCTSPLMVPPTDVTSWLVKVGVECASNQPKEVIRSVVLCAEKVHDPRSHIAQEMDGLPRMRRVEEPSGLLHKLHHTAFRETLASEVVATSLYEYDGLPWQFYIDMCRQCEDEARHSLMTFKLLASRGGFFG